MVEARRLVEREPLRGWYSAHVVRNIEIVGIYIAGGSPE